MSHAGPQRKYHNDCEAAVNRWRVKRLHRLIREGKHVPKPRANAEDAWIDFYNIRLELLTYAAAEAGARLHGHRGTALEDYRRGNENGWPRMSPAMQELNDAREAKRLRPGTEAPNRKGD